MVEGLEELWDEKQYEDEYNLDNFMSSLSSWGENLWCVIF
jgi:hypothetical protein